jgi:hypothetical protein
MVNRRTVVSGLVGLPASTGVAGASSRATAADDPTVATRAPLDVDASSVLVRGFTEGTDDDFDALGFEYWELGRKDETTEQRLSESTVDLDQPPVGGFRELLSGLEPETTYVYRAVGKRSWSIFDRTTYGELFTVTTAPTTSDDPVVETLEPTNKDGDKATLRGELVDLGAYDSVDLYVRYEPPLTFGITRTVLVERDVTEPKSFETTVAGLNPKADRRYSVTAIAAPGNTDRYVYSDAESVLFETATPEPLQLETSQVRDVGATSATLEGELSAIGAASAPRLAFEYRPKDGQDSESSVAPASPPVATAATSFEATTEGLEPDTTYVVEASAVTENVGVETTSIEFTTAAAASSQSDPSDDSDTKHSAAATTADEPADALDTLFWGSDIETLGVEQVDATGARFRGEIELETDEYRYLGFEYWPKGERDSVSERKVTVEPPESPGSYETTVEGLKAGTTYVVRAYYRVGNPPFARDVTGEEIEFTTTEQDAGGDPVVRVREATDIEPTRATIRGELVQLGDFDRVWVLVTCKNGDTFARGYERVVLDGPVTDPQTYEIPVTGLEPGLGYESRITAIGLREGDRVEVSSQRFEFGTPDVDWTTVETTEVTEVTATGATVRGALLDTRQSDLSTQTTGRIGAGRADGWTRLHVRYWKADEEDANRRYRIPEQAIATEPGDVTARLAGLESNTTYRAQVVDTLTLEAGEVVEFTTTAQN